MSTVDLEDRISNLENALELERSRRIRMAHDFEHRLTYMEGVCLQPALSRIINGPIPWLWKLLGLNWRPGGARSAQIMSVKEIK